MDIHALNRRRAETAQLLRALETVNMSDDYAGRIKLDARCRLARDNWLRAEQAYQRAIDALSPEELATLAK